MTKTNFIYVNNLKYKYPDGTNALNGISFNVSEGEKIAIIGPNGAGKTTLLYLINGILKGEGEIFIDNIRVDDNNWDKIRNIVGLIFQNPDDQLFCSTVNEDISFGLINLIRDDKEIKKRVEKVLKFLNMIKFKDKSPHHLSYGEKKRIALASVLVRNPEIIMFDEPTSNLDPFMRKKFINLIKKIKKTIIIATHDLEMVYEICNKVIVINNGKINIIGDTDNILSDENLMRKNKLEVPAIIKLIKYKIKR